MWRGGERGDFVDMDVEWVVKSEQMGNQRHDLVNESEGYAHTSNAEQNERQRKCINIFHIVDWGTSFLG